MATGIVEGSTVKPMISFHPQPNETGSAQWFQQDDWLSFHMFQNGHCRYTAMYDKIQTVYNMQPTKPVMDAEPLYEDHPVCFDAKATEHQMLMMFASSLTSICFQAPSDTLMDVMTFGNSIRPTVMP